MNCLFLTALFLLSATPFYDQKGYVNDYTDTLSSQKRAFLQKELASLEATDDIQCIVSIVPSLQGVRIQDLSQQFFVHWQIGHKGKDSGILFLVAKEEKEAYIDLGYGLEDLITETQAMRIAKEVIEPLLAQNKTEEAVELGVKAIFTTIGASMGSSTVRPVYTTIQATIFLLSIPLLYLVAHFAPTRLWFLSPLIGFAAGILQSTGLALALGALGATMVLISYILKRTFQLK